MIISCPECNKRFNIDQNLIPKDGRLLQCSNCKYKWFFKIDIKDVIKDESLKPEKAILENNSEEIIINPSKNDLLVEENSKIELKKKKKVVNKTKKNQTKKRNQNSKDKPIGLLNMIIIIIISFIAVVIVLDTFRIELSKYIPFLNTMLDSFYAIITDINSFIRDLIR